MGSVASTYTSTVTALALAHMTLQSFIEILSRMIMVIVAMMMDDDGL